MEHPFQDSGSDLFREEIYLRPDNHRGHCDLLPASLSLYDGELRDSRELQECPGFHGEHAPDAQAQRFVRQLFRAVAIGSMTTNVVVPRLGSSDESDQVTIVRWLKAPGAQVKKGDALLEVETDKVNVEIEAPDDGVLKEIKAAAGDTVRFSSVVAVIETG